MKHFFYVYEYPLKTSSLFKMAYEVLVQTACSYFWQYNCSTIIAHHCRTRGHKPRGRPIADNRSPRCKGKDEYTLQAVQLCFVPNET